MGSKMVKKSRQKAWIIYFWVIEIFLYYIFDMK